MSDKIISYIIQEVRDAIIKVPLYVKFTSNMLDTNGKRIQH